MGVKFCVSLIGSISLVGLGALGMINQNNNHGLHIAFIVVGIAVFLKLMIKWKRS